MALLAVLVVALGGAAWLYVKHGDSLLGVSPFHGHVTATASERAGGRGTEVRGTEVRGTEVTYAGQAAPIELPCAIRHADIEKVLAYLTLKGRKTHRDLVSVCRYYGTTVGAATS